MRQTQLNISTVAKAAVIFGIGFISMANEGCQDQMGPTRQLKKIAEIGDVRAGNFSLPGGGQFDFQFVAAAQVGNLIAQSDEFTLLYDTSVPTSPGVFNISATDAELYEDWSGGERFSTADLSQEAECLLDRPQVRVSANVLSFQMTSGGGITVGFGPNGSFDTSFIDSVSLDVKQARMDVTMEGRDPLSRVVLGSAKGLAYQRQYDIGLVINFGAFRLGPRYFFESPLAEVSETGLKQALSKLSENMANDTWYTRLVSDLDTHIIIQAGANAGLKIGDVVAVYNETHNWSGRPCMSELKGSFKEPATPVLLAEITSVGNAIAQARVDRASQTIYKPEIGARVEVHSFVEDRQQ